MKNTILLILCLFLLSCASGPKMTLKEKCSKVTKAREMAISVLAIDLTQAAKYATEAVRLCPNGINFAVAGYIDAKKGWLDLGVQMAREGWKLEPQNPDVLTYCGLTYAEAGKFDQAISFLGKALNYRPKDPLARETLAEIYIVRRELAKAEVELLKNINNNPTFPKSYYFLGKLYMDEMLEPEKAFNFLSKYLLLDAQNVYGYVEDTRRRLVELKQTMQENERNKEAPHPRKKFSF